MLATLDRALHGLFKGWLDDHRVRVMLRASLFAAIVAAIALLAIDPAVPRFGGVAALMRTGDASLRESALSFLAANGLVGRARLYLWVDALVFAPMCALVVVALLLHFDHLLRADGTPPAFLRFELRWRLLIALPLAALGVHVLAAAVTLYLLAFAGAEGSPMPAALHRLVKTAGWASVWTWGAAALACLWLFTSWFFRSQDDAGNGAFQRARLRAAVADMLWRSKYAVAILLLYGVLLLGMDQTRDALLRQILDADERPLSALLGAAITLAGLLLFARASWFWPRVILRLSWPDAAQVSDPQIEAFAKWWCRVLGLVPLAVVAVVLARSMHDVHGDRGVLGWLAIADVVIVALAAYYLARVAWRDRATSIGYYGVAADSQAAAADMSAMRLWVTWGAPVVFLVARFTGLMGWTPPLALPVITCGLATWAGILGWVAYMSRRAAAPYMLVGIAIVGILGILDVTDAHRVRSWSAAIGAFDATAMHVLFAGTLVLALLTAALAWFWSREYTTATARIVSALAWIIAVSAVIKLYDRDPGPPANPGRPQLEQAMTSWLDALHAELKDRAPGQRMPVFLVSAEGGGIRSAYWTASVLARMRGGIEGFDRHVFSLAGVSGGAVGVAVHRGCARTVGVDTRRMRDCIDTFGRADLWTQLLGGLLFEDALATVVPTSWCRNPGCALLGRSNWFEGAMETAVPALASGVVGGRSVAPDEPHAFLAVTAVETGARVLQSDVAIDSAQFPGARDAIGMMHSDLRWSTAAHNSSRFPYTNPVGAVYGPNCKETPAQRAGSWTAARNPLCTRLQDGGYFDDSATQTTSDILRMMRKCLDGLCGGADHAKRAKELRDRIKPVVVTIRNEAKYEPGPADEPVCANPHDPRRNPAFADERAPLEFYPSVLSAPVTLYNTRGAHMWAAEAELELDAKALWSALNLPWSEEAPTPCGTVDQWIGDKPYRRFDLIDDGTLYPSGWLLSRQALSAMCRQAERQLPVSRPLPSCAAPPQR